MVFDKGGALDLKVMTLNVRYENAQEGGERSWRQRVVGVVGVVMDEAPDVFAVQEALHGQIADLWACLPDYEFYGVGRDDGRREGEYAGIFYRRARFECVGEQGVQWLSDNPQVAGSKTWGNMFPRVMIWLRLRDVRLGREFYVYNTHWDHLNRGSREKSARQMVAHIIERKPDKVPFVIMGDFNAVETNPDILYLKSAGKGERGQRSAQGFVDTFQVVNPNEKNRRTLHFWKGTREGILKVDHILVNQWANVVSAQIRDRERTMVSDHFPVTARVIFPQK
jgi:endonuclease/exonuclease/phosphatase family metal-dependent hydrolase